MSNYSVKVGDMIVDSDQIHVVSKIENGLVSYHPLTKDANGGNNTGSIPLDNFSKAGIRPILTKKDVKTFLKNLPTEKPLNVPVYNFKNNNSLKEYLYLNDPTKTGQFLIYLKGCQKDSPLSNSDQAIFDQAVKHLSDEISVVNQIPFTTAKKQLLSALKM
jgi:RNA polymerase-interacting CarD/CdnL/TRCF family regulator